jgi:hypothetical protein
MLRFGAGGVFGTISATVDVGLCPVNHDQNGARHDTVESGEIELTSGALLRPSKCLVRSVPVGQTHFGESQLGGSERGQRESKERGELLDKGTNCGLQGYSTGAGLVSPTRDTAH